MHRTHSWAKSLTYATLGSLLLTGASEVSALPKHDQLQSEMRKELSDGLSCSHQWSSRVGEISDVMQEDSVKRISTLQEFMEAFHLITDSVRFIQPFELEASGKANNIDRDSLFPIPLYPERSTIALQHASQFDATVSVTMDAHDMTIWDIRRRKEMPGGVLIRLQIRKNPDGSIQFYDCFPPMEKPIIAHNEQEATAIIRSLQSLNEELKKKRKAAEGK